MQRRDFIKLNAIFCAVAGLPLWSSRVFAADFPTLPIPPLLAPDATGNIDLTIQSGTSYFRPTVATPTWGYNGALL